MKGGRVRIKRMSAEQQRRWMREIDALRRRLAIAAGMYGEPSENTEPLPHVVGYTIGRLRHLLEDWGHVE